MTSAGHLDGGGGRRRAKIPGQGPAAMITDLGRYEFRDGEMTLVSLHPGVTEAEVRASLGWEPRAAKKLEVTPAPTAEELWLLRGELAYANSGG